MSYSNSERYYRTRMSSSCSLKSEDSDNENDFDMDDGASMTNSSSTFSRVNSSSYGTSSVYSLNDKRRSRNQNEKKRRDQFNLLIQELGNLLNHPRKIDKATVLNETLFFFRNYNEKPLYNKEIDFKYKPFFLQNDEYMRFMIEFQNAFCLVFDLNGQIKYVSDDIMHLMGHYPKNLQNCSLFDFVDEKSSKQIKNILKRKYSPADTICFDCKFKKLSDSNSIYEPVRIKGFFKRCPNSAESGHFNTIAKLESFMRINELYPRDNNKREFTSEFSMDLKYTSLDPKATEIIGYSPIEILGTCGYDYCHHDDLEKLTDCHKKLLQNGAVPLIAYRFRTKGLQWLWIQSRFEILYHQIVMKPYAILVHNHIISLSEMTESKELIDNSSSSKFNSSYAQSSKDSNSSDCVVIDIKTEFDTEIKNNDKWSNQQQFYNTNEDQDLVAHRSNLTNNGISEPVSLNRPNYQYTQNIESKQHIKQQPQQQQQQQQQKQNAYTNTSNQRHQISDSNQLSQISTEIKSDKHIDESLGSIFLRSFNDIEYRNYVLSQFKMKKQKIESVIKKHQDELKILEETMENISDEKKLASWVMEFQRQEFSKTNQNSMPKNIRTEPIQQQKIQQHQQPQHKLQTIDNRNNQIKYLTNEQSSYQQQQQQQKHHTQMIHHQSTTSSNLINQHQQTNYMMEGKNVNNNPNLIQKTNQERNYLKQQYIDLEDRFDIKSFQNLKTESNRPSKRVLSNSPERSSTSNEESELVGQLISFQNYLPNNLNQNKNNDNDNINNNSNNNKNSNLSINNNTKNSISTQSLQSIDLEDVNSDMIEKLFNNYTFESFSSQ